MRPQNLPISKTILYTLLIFNILSTQAIGGPKNKTFRNITVLYNILTGSLNVASNAIINNNLNVFGQINANNISTQSLTTNNLNVSGNITFPTLSEGVVQSNTSGNLSASKIVVLNSITKNGNTTAWPTGPALAGKALVVSSDGQLAFGASSGGGNVNTAGFATINAIVKVSATGTDVIDSGITIDGANNVTGANQITSNTFVGALDGLASKNLALAGGTMLGDIDMGNKNITGADKLTVNGTGTFNGSLIAINTITGNISGSAASFTGQLAGDVIGLQGDTKVTQIGSTSATGPNSIESGAIAANNASSTGVANRIVILDSSSTFTATTMFGHASEDLSLSGGTMTGDINMGTHNITGVGQLSVNGTGTFNGPAYFNAGLTATGPISFTGEVNMNNQNINNVEELYVNATGAFNGNVSFNETITANGAAELNCSTSFGLQTEDLTADDMTFDVNDNTTWLAINNDDRFNPRTFKLNFITTPATGIILIITNDYDPLTPNTTSTLISGTGNIANIIGIGTGINIGSNSEILGISMIHIGGNIWKPFSFYTAAV